MRQISLKYGIIGGVLISIPMFIVILNIDSIGFDKGVTVLFISMIISFIAVFLGIGSVRKNIGGGYIGFRLALMTGIIITVITSVFYVISSMLLFYVIAPGFNAKYNAYTITQMQAMHIPQVEIDKYIADAAKQSGNQSLIISAGLMLIKPIMFGLFFTIPSVFILRKKEFPTTLN